MAYRDRSLIGQESALADETGAKRLFEVLWRMRDDVTAGACERPDGDVDWLPPDWWVPRLVEGA